MVATASWINIDTNSGRRFEVYINSFDVDVYE